MTIASRLGLLAVLLVGVGGSCSPVPDPSPGSDVRNAAPDAGDPTIEELIGRLRVVSGRFTSEVPPQFSHEDLFLEIAAFGEDAVRPLVACFDDVRPTRTDYRGARLRLGHLCMAAFSYVAYHEAVDGHGDIDGAWAGYVGLDATVEELRQAAAAWREVIDAGQYVVYPAG